MLIPPSPASLERGPGGEARPPLPYLASVGLGAVGLAIAAYLTIVHCAQGAVPLLCSTTGPINCEQVTTSAQSMLGPVPVSLLGALWFLGLLGLLARAGAQPIRPLQLIRFGWLAAGLLFVFYLIFAELVLIGAICLWCTAVHLIVIALFLIGVGESALE